MKAITSSKNLCFVLLAASALAGTQNIPAADASPDSLRVYFIGNSVTDTVRYGSLTQLAASRGHQLVWGRQMIPGAPLQWLWDHHSDGFTKKPFGYPREAFANFQWDVVSLQPFDRLLVEARNATPFLKKPLLLIPVGHAMHALDRRMRAGEVAGYTDIHQLYKDGIHLNETGSYLVVKRWLGVQVGRSSHERRESDQ